MNLTIPREDRFFIYAQTADSLPSKPLILQTDGDSFFECTSIHFHTGQGTFNNVFDNYTIQLRELGSAAQGFFNIPIMPSLVFSKAGNAKQLRTPFILPPNSMIQIDLAAEPSGNVPLGNADVVDIAFWGIKRYQMSPEEYAKRRQRPYFVYATDIITAFPSTKFIQIATDGDFVVQNICSYGDVGNTTAGSNMDFRSATIQITDESTQKQLFENPLPWSQISAQASVWRGNNRLMSPLIFRRNTPIRIDFGGTVTTNLAMQFGFEGFKIKD